MGRIFNQPKDTTMSTTLRTPESYLDEVASDLGFETAKEYFIHNFASENLRLSAEAMRRMLEDAFKAQKEICAEHTKLKYVEGSSYKGTLKIIDKSSILEAPTPKTINQNKTDHEST